MLAGSDISIEQQIQNWVNLVERGAPLEDIQQAEYELSEAMKRAPFEMKQQIPFFLKLARKLDARIPFQQFRLPGKDRVVVDRRDMPRGEPKEAAREASKESAKEAAKEAASKETAREAGRAKDAGRASFAARGGLEQQAATDRVERLLSAFEKMVIARFEEGRQIARESPDGKPHFLAKTEKQWSEFFRSFLHRTIKKRALLAEIRNFLLRGVVARGTRGVFIGDMNMSSGRVEKFVRFSILAEALAKMQNMRPGETIGKDILGKLSSEELMYLALAASRARAFAGTKKAAQGKFVGGRAEAMAARALGLSLDEQLREKARRLKRGRGGLGKLFGEEVPAEEIPYRFVPWWRWGNLTRPGKFRWVTVVFYASLLALALMGIGVLTYRLLGGG